MTRRSGRIAAGGLAVLVPLALISLRSVRADDSDAAVTAAPSPEPWPASWSPLDAQAGDAKDGTLRVGDAAAGCFATQRHIPIGDEARMEGIIDGLSAALSTGSLTVGGLVSSDESASFAFAGGQHEGLVHIRIEGDQPRTATMLSCFWNQREARLCKRLCQETIGQAATDSGDATEPTGVTQP